MDSYWYKLLEVVDRTRDKVFFFAKEKPYVVLSLEQFEQLIGMQTDAVPQSEAALLDQINRDIALWRARTMEETMADDQLEQSVTEAMRPLSQLRHHEEVEPQTIPLGESEPAQMEDEFHIEPVNI